MIVLVLTELLLGARRTFSELDASLDIDSLPPPDIQGTIREPACSHVH